MTQVVPSPILMEIPYTLMDLDVEDWPPEGITACTASADSYVYCFSLFV